MNEQLQKYLNDVFSPYQDLKTVSELKEELFIDLQEKLADLKNQGYDDETAFRMTIDSIGDISEIIESIGAKTRELLELVGKNFSMRDLRNSDLKAVKVHDGKFNYSDLQKTDFSGSDLKNCSFKFSDLREVRFDGTDLTRAKLVWSDLKGASFNNCVLDNTDFNYSDLSGACFDRQTFNHTILDNTTLTGTSFKNAVFRSVSFKKPNDVRQAIFDGATMDKLTFAILKGYGANLTNVTMA